MVHRRMRSRTKLGRVAGKRRANAWQARLAWRLLEWKRAANGGCPPPGWRLYE